MADARDLAAHLQVRKAGELLAELLATDHRLGVPPRCNILRWRELLGVLQVFFHLNAWSNLAVATDKSHEVRVTGLEVGVRREGEQRGVPREGKAIIR